MRKRDLDIWKCEDCEEEYNDNDPRVFWSVQDTNTKQKTTGKLICKMLCLCAENVKNCLKGPDDVLSNHCRLHCFFITGSMM